MNMPIVDSSFNVSESLSDFDIIVVGAGFFGLTIAERVAAELDRKVLVLEVRDHIGGNAYSYFDPITGIEIHKYGSHLFHTSNDQVWEYVNRFSSFTDYRHRVYAKHESQVYSLPINLHTISQMQGRFVSPNEAAQIIKDDSSSANGRKDFESIALERVGKKIYEAFFKNYTQKQWRINPTELPGSTFGRLPVRFTFNNDYFSDKHQGLPTDGYEKLFMKMIAHENIFVALETDFFNVRQHIDFEKQILVYTGPLDRFHDYDEGLLTWRTLDFQIETHNLRDYQGTSVMNYVDADETFTRIHEFKHLHPERGIESDSTVIMKEYSRLAKEHDEPYYPVNSPNDRLRLEAYRGKPRSPNVIFGGRLGSYMYLDMHMAIASALSTFDQVVSPKMKENT
jgi:UDP-galactopyranose mutase